MTIHTCTITVKGNGIGKYGHSVKDRTGIVKDFIVDNTVLYTAVYKHVKDCTNGCNPIDVLQTYLDRRISDPKFKGMTSSGLSSLCFKYERLIKKMDFKFGSMDFIKFHDIVTEILLRDGPCELVMERGGAMAIARSWLLVVNGGMQARYNPGRNSTTKISYICKLVEDLKDLPDESELESLCIAADVQLS